MIWSQIQSRPTPRIWERRGGILTDDDTPGGVLGGRSILTERSQIIKRDKDQAPSSPFLTGLYGWYRADALTLDDSDPVTSWEDESGQGNDLAQAGSASIIYVTNALNGLPIVRFVPSASFVGHLELTPISAGGIFTGVTQVFVMRCLFNATFPNTRRSTVNTGDDVATLQGDTTGDVSTIFSIDGILPLTEAIDDWQIISLRHNNSDSAIHLETATQSASGTFGGGSVIGDFIGLMNGSMEVAESLWYRASLSDDDLASTRLYLANKYAISITV
jgi:hypothetical protein